MVLPLNHLEVITRVLHRFQLHADDVIEIKDTNKEFLVSDCSSPFWAIQLRAKAPLNTTV